MKILDKFQLAGFIISATVSIGFLLITRPTDPTAGVILGFVLAILTQLFDMQRRQADSEEKLLQANALSQSLYRDEWLFKHIQEITEDYQIAKGSRAELFQEHARDGIVECRNLLHSITEGHIVSRRRALLDFSTEVAGIAKESVKAVDTGNIAYWRKTYMEKYLQLNIAAVQRGVSITRIFVYPMTILQQNIDLLEQQRSAGIEVYIAEPAELPHELNEDYLVVDDWLAVRVEFTPDGRVQGNEISVSEIEVAQILDRFNRLVRYARKVDEVIDALRQH